MLAAIAIGALASRVTNADTRAALERVTSDLMAAATKEITA